MENLKRLLLVVVAVACGFSVPATLSVQAGTPAQDTSLCDAADRLVQQGYPQQAISALSAAVDSADPCLAAGLAAADAAVSSAQGYLDQANKLYSFGYYDSALTQAKLAAKTDKENAAAATLVGVLSTEDDESPAQTALTGWEAFVERMLTPLGDLLVPALAVLLAGLIVARVLVVIRPDTRRDSSSGFGIGVGVGVVGVLIVAGLVGWQLYGANNSLFGQVPDTLLASIALGLVAAGLIVFSFGIISNNLRIVLSCVGLSVLAISACLLVLGLATQSEGGAYWLAPLAILLGLPALALVAMTWASRLRLSIDARKDTGTTDEVLSGQIIALLSELAGGRPEGLEVPRGADLSVLSNTPISGFPENKIAAALSVLWQTFFALTPWQIRVDISGTESCSVVITRNGKTIKTAVVDRSSLRLDPPTDSPRTSLTTTKGSPTKSGSGDGVASVDASPGNIRQLQVMVCAVTLLALATRHRGFEGLLGAKDWRSVGLAYLATRNANDSDEVRKRLLVAAVDVEPANLPAQVALRWIIYRDSTDQRELFKYAQWLADANVAIKSKSGCVHTVPSDAETGAGNWLAGATTSKDVRKWQKIYQRDPSYALRLRVLNTMLAVHCNAIGPPKSDETLPRKVSDPLVMPFDSARLTAATDELIWMISCAPAESRSFADDLKISVAASCVDVSKVSTPATGPKNLGSLATFLKQINWVGIGPYSEYNLACHLAAEKDYSSAVDHLRFADAESRLAKWREKDPWLADLRKDPHYREAFDRAKRTSVFDLSPFDGLEKALRAGGLGTAEKIAAAQPMSVAQVAAIKVWDAQRLIGIAQLGLRLVPVGEPDEEAAVRWEFAAGLVENDVESIGDLQSLPAGPRWRLLVKVCKDLEQRFEVSIPLQHSRWCGSLGGCSDRT